MYLKINLLFNNYIKYVVKMMMQEKTTTVLNLHSNFVMKIKPEPIKQQTTRFVQTERVANRTQDCHILFISLSLSLTTGLKTRFLTRELRGDE